ncbi:50S ribosomal protein L10 [Ethanoligenens harbinense]|uniref:Large ribosomal subunit protein uL10 n=1 Tax=Ethanoligenens harbinense (strain DSM 18485 / JCM 12961 / CGMCC 1.5033 / YUAN-3) TaxID=663278 RepID=E6U3J4_ETHHY|nr:50S ribosomal protein L10 [Ethanoligenens harbinense]ADU27594.1 ribosomal protein L10 [Ethanoligenens harbinense YUAN-3]AVQ96639.1 50S ribosomal protein L10 [Ethanoligenens harbinense YUAN-3]AYF39300.1 50S ribosomal protein L10 [Ethanoligenens harbinense]AYF42124.1 50S ribosomal protein L10 [Ethanoligenens harbinense]QCN92879.1 50S ribosomal protein L10 [Ethanoligenens harbinense]
MPSEKILAQKQQLVTGLAEQLKASISGVLVDYTGISVEDDTKLRAELRAANVDYSVKKNSIIGRAAEAAGLTGLDDVLKGATALATSTEDLVAPAKILAKFAETHPNFKIKAGFIEGKAATGVEVEALAKLPPKEVLVAKALGGLNAPISGFVMVLNANLRGLVVALNAIAEKQSA